MARLPLFPVRGLPDLALHPRLAISRATVDGVAVAPADLPRHAPAAAYMEAGLRDELGGQP